MGEPALASPWQIVVGGALLLACLGLLWLLPCYLQQRRTGEISGWLAVPSLFVAIGVWITCMRVAGVV